MEPRHLHAYPTGDFWRKKVVPLIRLQGKWLERAGFPPGCPVIVEIKGDGVLTVRKMEYEGDGG
jgi:hypothetical protein